MIGGGLNSLYDLLLLFMFLLACGRYFQTSSLLESAARDGARGASQSRSLAEAQGRVDEAVTDTMGQAVKPHYKVLNMGSTAVPLSQLTIRYWYTLDAPIDTELSQCDFAQLGCNNIMLSNVALSPTKATADHYFQVGFAPGAGNLAATNGNTGEIQIWFHKTGWSLYTQTNDPSFDATKTAYADWNKVTLYQNGTLVWGTEPP